MMNKSAVTLLAAILLAAGTATAAADGVRTAQEKIAQTNWAGVRGVNFVPSYASNTYEIWRNYDHTVFDRELRLVEAVGYNSVRLWLNYSVYEEIGPQMVDRVEDALRLCAKYHLRAVITLFDSCGIRPRPDARWITASEAYDHFMNKPRLSTEEKQFLQQLFGPYVKGFGKNTLVPVSSNSPIMTILWQSWQSTPGNDRLGPEWYPKLEAYVDALMDRLKDNPNVLEWDMMNEPELGSEEPYRATQSAELGIVTALEAWLTHFHGYIKQRYPNELVAIGWATLDNCQKHVDLADVLNFHVYAEPDKLQRTLDQAAALSKSAGKPIIITETLANWDFGSPDFGKLACDECQLAHYQNVLPVLLRSPIGWMAWGMIISRSFNSFTDIFFPNGHPRPAAVYLEKMLKGATKGQQVDDMSGLAERNLKLPCRHVYSQACSEIPPDLTADLRRWACLVEEPERRYLSVPPARGGKNDRSYLSPQEAGRAPKPETRSTVSATKR